MSTEISGVDIFNDGFTLVKFIVLFSVNRAKEGVYLIATTLKGILVWFIYSLPEMPIYLFLAIIGILACFLWNETLKPLIQILIQGWNGAIRAWNNVASTLRNLGFEIPLPTGSIGINLGIPAPDGQEVSVDIPDFIPFVMNILIPVLFKPLKERLTGIIFA
jgi:xanthosine utilization system XapX-like protein